MLVSKAKLKAKMLEYFREVERTGEPLIVTDHGREVLEIRPVVPQKQPVAEVVADLRQQLFGSSFAKISEEELMAPAWREEDEADDSWWINPTRGAE